MWTRFIFSVFSNIAKQYLVLECTMDRRKDERTPSSSVCMICTFIKWSATEFSVCISRVPGCYCHFYLEIYQDCFHCVEKFAQKGRETLLSFLNVLNFNLNVAKSSWFSYAQRDGCGLWGKCSNNIPRNTVISNDEKCSFYKCCNH